MKLDGHVYCIAMHESLITYCTNKYARIKTDDVVKNDATLVGALMSHHLLFAAVVLFKII